MTSSANPIIIFDTNVLISAALIKNSQTGKSLKKALIIGLLAFSKETISEINEILKRPKFEKYLSSNERQEFLTRLLSVSRIFEPTIHFNICRDPKDNIFLDLIFESKANFMITGDQDLLVLNPFERAEILSPSDFLEKEII